MTRSRRPLDRILATLALSLFLAPSPPSCLLAQNAEPTAAPPETDIWLVDLDEAVARSKKENKPIFLAFVGSDWCRYCIIMDNDVFSQDAWTDYAKEKLILVNVDFPEDRASLSVERWLANQRLKDRFGVAGFPTYILLDADGTSVLARLSFSEGANHVYRFMRHVGVALRHRPAERVAFLASLSDGDAEYSRLLDKHKNGTEAFDAWLKARPESNERNTMLFSEYTKKISEIEARIEQIELSKFLRDMAGDGSDNVMTTLRQAQSHIERMERIRDAKADLENWLLSRPAPTHADRAAFQRLLDRLSGAMP